MASQELEVLQEGSNEKNSKRGKTRKWTEEETEKLIDLLEENTCLWDVSNKEYLLKNKREKALSDMSDELDMEVADTFNGPIQEFLFVIRILMQKKIKFAQFMKYTF